MNDWTKRRTPLPGLLDSRLANARKEVKRADVGPDGVSLPALVPPVEDRRREDERRLDVADAPPFVVEANGRRCRIGANPMSPYSASPNAAAPKVPPPPSLRFTVASKFKFTAASITSFAALFFEEEGSLIKAGLSNQSIVTTSQLPSLRSSL